MTSLKHSSGMNRDQLLTLKILTLLYIKLSFNELPRSIAFNFSHVFDGTIWNIKVSDQNSVMVLEVRDHEQRVVRFSALNYQTQEFLWRDKVLDDPWWINLAGISGSIVLFTFYTDSSNPDKKATIAYHLQDGKLAWWNNDFSIHTISRKFVAGYAEKFGKRELVLDIYTGATLGNQEPDLKNYETALRPHHYPADHPYFDTVKRFLNQKFNLLPTAALEYLEHDSLIFISCYLRENELANYLFIISPDGALLLQEKLAEHLKGIGLDTFFVLSGCVFFVRNKGELVSYKIL